jgi:carboxypeptidase family protein
MRPVRRYALLFAVMLVVIPTVSSAQFRGLGRITGTVSEEGGGPMGNVSVRATLTGEDGVIEEKSDEKGAWAVSGVAKGEWHLTFQIAGYIPVGAKVTLPAELARIAPISITLKKVSKG